MEKNATGREHHTSILRLKLSAEWPTRLTDSFENTSRRVSRQWDCFAAGSVNSIDKPAQGLRR